MSDTSAQLAELACPEGGWGYAPGQQPHMEPTCVALLALGHRPEHAATIILSLAAGEVSEESLTRWIRDNWPSE